ncbi:MAG TPA: helix-turn-helix transcriptional regulator [Tepidisphaeraceae bacterium]|nr:helix-turn-helix transcriptional regulator [Tepidisphaeraceae bacterium]
MTKKKRSSKNDLSFPARIRKARERRKLNQSDAAAKIGVSRITWNYWEREKRKPSGTARRLLGIIFPELK